MVLAFVILWIWTLADADKKSNPQETTFWFKAIMLMAYFPHIAGGINSNYLPSGGGF
jgi:hypothetical protein